MSKRSGLAASQIHCVVVDGRWRVVSVLDVMRGLHGGDRNVTAAGLATPDPITIPLDETGS